MALDQTPAAESPRWPNALRIRRFVPLVSFHATTASMVHVRRQGLVRAVQCLTADCDERRLGACVGALAAQPSSPGIYNERMTISARNKLRGKIEEIQLGDIMAHVVVRVGDNLIESVITRRSADELKFKKGDTVAAVVKATEVMIQKD
jgi:molybdopterin-binding protein